MTEETKPAPKKKAAKKKEVFKMEALKKCNPYPADKQPDNPMVEVGELFEITDKDIAQKFIDEGVAKVIL